MKKDLIIVIPVFNDWESLSKLQLEIEGALPSTFSIHFLVVDDSSDDQFQYGQFSQLISTTTIIELSRNLGHQKAIATGLAYVNENYQTNAVIVMDSDGEDRPLDIPSLLKCSSEFNVVVFAKRAKRTEGLLFCLFYQLYKIAFVVLTGKKINFGNFCVIPVRYLRKLVHVPDIWNHFSGGIIRSGIPYTAIATVRGRRYFGESKMNFTRLVLHGLSAVAVYADLMSVRLILLSFLLTVITLAGIAAVVGVRLFTTLAIPGWATFSVLGLGILFFLALLMGLFLLFNVLSLKTQKRIIPAKDYKDFIFNCKELTPQSIQEKTIAPEKEIATSKA